MSVKAPKKAAEFLERLLPETDEQSGEAFADRQTRRKTAHKMDRTFDRAIQTFDRIEKELDKEEESVEQREWDDRDERRRSDERSREREEDRKDRRLDLEAEERRKAMTHKDVFLVLTVVTTVAAIVLAYMTAEAGRFGYTGVSVLGAILSNVFYRRLRWPSHATGPESTAPGARAWRWSVLDLQGEVDEEMSEGSS